MLRFDDIANLCGEDIRTVYREVTPLTLATALKDVPPEVADKFFQNMSSPIAEMTREVMRRLGEVPRAQIEEEQDKVLRAIQALHTKRRIR